MLGLKDLLAVLERWPKWKRIAETPDRLDAMERRVADIEQQLGDTSPENVCKTCGEPGLVLGHTGLIEKTGVVKQRWDCPPATIPNGAPLNHADPGVGGRRSRRISELAQLVAKLSPTRSRPEVWRRLWL